MSVSPNPDASQTSALRAITPDPPSTFSSCSSSSSSASSSYSSERIPPDLRTATGSSQSLECHLAPLNPPASLTKLSTTALDEPQSRKMTLYPLRLYTSDRPPSPLALTSTVAPPSLMHTTATASSTTSRKPSANLRLSMLPQHSPTSPAPQRTPQSPHIHNYAHSLSAQQKLQLHQREIINSATRASGIPQHLLSSGPLSPRLIPLGSPGGPVTPLMLEQEKQESYFVGFGGGVQSVQSQRS